MRPIISFLTLCTLIYLYIPNKKEVIDYRVAKEYQLVDNFIKDACKNNDWYFQPRSILVYLDDGIAKKGYDGLCYRLPFEFIIKINKGFWLRSTEEERIQLMAHELSHCRLRINHSNDDSNYMYITNYSVPFSKFIPQLFDNIYSTCRDNKSHSKWRKYLLF